MGLPSASECYLLGLLTGSRATYPAYWPLQGWLTGSTDWLKRLLTNLTDCYKGYWLSLLTGLTNCYKGCWKCYLPGVQRGSKGYLLGVLTGSKGYLLGLTDLFKRLLTWADWLVQRVNHQAYWPLQGLLIRLTNYYKGYWPGLLTVTRVTYSAYWLLQGLLIEPIACPKDLYTGHST